MGPGHHSDLLEWDTGKAPIVNVAPCLQGRDAILSLKHGLGP